MSDANQYPPLREDCDQRFMVEAIRQAQAALEVNEIPVGAVVVFENRIIGRAHNQRHLLKDPTAHAEMIALTQAAEYRGDWRLTGCSMYVTLEPCPMCAGALINARIDRVVFGPYDPKAGACGSIYNLVEDRRFNHSMEVIGDFMAEPCRLLLKEFFAQRRQK